jgi:carboxymethylenebutenolidase
MRFLPLSRVLLTVVALACTTSQPPAVTASPPQLPPDAPGAAARIAASPRHGEWVVVRTGPADSVRAWVVYPERSTKAPVVIVVQEIFGLSSWIRSVADQLAADGFIAIAPDLLTMKNLPTGPDSVLAAVAPAATRSLNTADVQRQLLAVAQYGMALPAAQQKYGIVGFCWGGGTSFVHAAHSPTLSAAVVYYGPNPGPPTIDSVRAPVLGLYGSDDARVNSTIPRADSALRIRGQTYVYNIYEGAGHGFLRQQSGKNGANLLAAQKAWPATIDWFRKYLGS